MGGDVLLRAEGWCALGVAAGVLDDRHGMAFGFTCVVCDTHK